MLRDVYARVARMETRPSFSGWLNEPLKPTHIDRRESTKKGIVAKTPIRISITSGTSRWNRYNSSIEDTIQRGLRKNTTFSLFLHIYTGCFIKMDNLSWAGENNPRLDSYKFSFHDASFTTVIYFLSIICVFLKVS